MRICAITKYPPIEGGVSARSYWIARTLAMRGHDVHVVTNAGEVEDSYRIWIPPEDRAMLEPSFENGGRVTVLASGQQRRALAHVPTSNPFVTKLASVATETIRRERCDVVFSYYFEPYGMSGHLAASWTGVPHVVQHAGSDRGRLMNHPDLVSAYREMLRHASLVVTGDKAFEGLGIPRARLARASLNFVPHQHFNAAAPPLVVDAAVSRLGRHPFVRNTAAWRDDVVTFGILGKVGEVKGSYDLVAALARLRDRGSDFNLLAMIGGTDRDRFLNTIDAAGLAERTWTLPLLPHWYVPAFLRRCTAVCFLERQFPIKAHCPGIPQEILACGVCAVLSREIADKQYFRDRLRPGENVLVVEDPSNVDELAEVLASVVSDPVRARAIGHRAASLVEAVDEDALGKTYEGLLQAAVDNHRRGHARTVSPADVRAFLSRRAPATMRALADEIDEAFDRWGAELARSYSSAALLAYHLVEKLSVPHDDERLRFERDLLWLAVDLEGPDGIPEFPRTVQRRRDEFVPVRSNWLRIGEYQERFVYVFHKRGDLGRRVYRVNRATQELIALCDGSRSVPEVDAALAERGIEAKGRTAEMINRLVRDGVLALW